MVNNTTHEVKWFHTQLGKSGSISDTHFGVSLKAVASTMCQMMKFLMAFPWAGRGPFCHDHYTFLSCHLGSNDARKVEILFFNTLFFHGHLGKNIYFLSVNIADSV